MNQLNNMEELCITMILCSVLHGLIIGAFIMGKSDITESVGDFIVKEVDDAYKQGYNDAIDKFCKFMQSCEGYVVSGNKCNYDNFIKYMEEQ